MYTDVIVPKRRCIYDTKKYSRQYEGKLFIKYCIALDKFAVELHY